MTDCNCDSPIACAGPWHAIGCCTLHTPDLPVQPYSPGALCETCGHFAGRHGPEGCLWIDGCLCKAMLWLDVRWPRPWLPAPEGLISS